MTSTHQARINDQKENIMATLHIENVVRDFDSWKSAFDKYDNMRRDKGVRSYRLTRQHDDPSKVTVDLDFDSVTRAEEFCEVLAKIWQSPQSQAELVSHSAPQLVDLVEARTL
jgi:hypothetical protein